jgi:hypothetical protein
MNRRRFLASLGLHAPVLGAVAPRFLRAAENSASEQLPAVRQITKGPRFYWFGYYLIGVTELLKV